MVMAIIALLMGLLFPTIATVKNQANKSKAAAAIQTQMTAASAYYNEYGKFPTPGGANAGAQLVLIFNGLRDPATGKIDTTITEQNPRRIQFMEYKIKDITNRSTAGSTGAASATGSPFFDPWGTPYGFCFDNGGSGLYYRGPGFTGAAAWRDQPAAYDNIIPEAFTTGSGTAAQINAGAAFFSNGPDQRTGTGPSNPSAGGSTASKILAYEDDVRSWK